MKSYKQLTGRYLVKQKKRSILAIVGIILSMALICAAGIMGESINKMINDEIIRRQGNYDVAFGDLDKKQLDMLISNAGVSAVGYKVDAAYYKPSEGRKLLITSCNDEVLNMMYMKLDSGRMPNQMNEIAVEKWVLDNMEGKPSLGSRIKLDIDVTKDASSGPSENSSVKESREFIVTGIFKNNEASQLAGSSMGIVSIEEAKSILKSENVRYMAAIRIKDKLPIQKTINGIVKSIGASEDKVSQNTAVLAIKGESTNQKTNKAIIVIEIIMVSVIIITTVAVIYNVFNISVLERVHQFGILRSIGTTPRQIKLLILCEALLLSAIGIPIGILCGIAGVKSVIGIFSLVSGKTLFGSLHVVISLKIILGSIGIGLVTVMLSAYGPAISAGRISPLEAIISSRKTLKGRIRKKKHPIITRIFGIEGSMAFENMKRNRKRFIVTLLSMCIGVTLFIFFNCFLNFLQSEFEDQFMSNYAIDQPFIKGTQGFSEKDYQDVSNINGVKSVYRIMSHDTVALIDKDGGSKEFKNYIKNNTVDSYRYENKDYSKLSAYVYSIREKELEIFKHNVIKGSSDIDNFDEDNGVFVLQKVELGKNRFNATNLKVGDEIFILAGENQTPVKLKVKGILDKFPFEVQTGSKRYEIVTTENVYKKITGSNLYSHFDIETGKIGDKDGFMQQLDNISKRVPDTRVLDYTERDGKVWAMQMSVILYGLVFVISLISSINIINTISTNIILRTKELGTLRAIGMTPGQMKKMIRLEGVFYGLIATIYGGIAGYALSRLLYTYLNAVQEITWKFSWNALIIGSIAAMVIGLLSTAVPLKRVAAMNVVEAVRSEE